MRGGGESRGGARGGGEGRGGSRGGAESRGGARGGAGYGESRGPRGGGEGRGGARGGAESRGGARGGGGYGEGRGARGGEGRGGSRGGAYGSEGRGGAFGDEGRGARGGGPAFSPDVRGGGAPDAPPVPEGAVTARRMVIYGRNPVREALRGKRKVHRIWATDPGEWAPAKVSAATAEEIEERAETENHQGVCALVDPYPYTDEAELLGATDPLIIALDEITDPQNLGAICRTAEAAGATGVVIPERRSAEVTPAVCKSSAGAVEHLPIARVRNLADFLQEAKDAGCWVYGAAAGGSTRYDQPDYKGGVVAVLGAEGKGLRQRVASMCDDLVSLPLLGKVDSLNVSATAAVLLYEMLQQRLDSST